MNLCWTQTDLQKLWAETTVDTYIDIDYRDKNAKEIENKENYSAYFLYHRSEKYDNDNNNKTHLIVL